MLILPALYIIKRKGKATTSDLISELIYVFNPFIIFLINKKYNELEQEYKEERNTTK